VTIRLLARRVLLAAAAIATALMAAALVTARPGDPNVYPPAPGAGAVEIFVVNHGYHTGIVLPRTSAVEIAARHNLTAVAAVATRFAAFSFLEIGWGDEGFYRAAPTISAVTVPMALRALFRLGNPSVLHVVGLNESPAVVFGNSELVPIRLSTDGFARMTAMLDASFARSEQGEPLDLGPGLYGPSLFFRAVGAFHIFNVCNHWVARLLDAAGVPTSPLLAIAPAGLLLDLRWRSGVHALRSGHAGDVR